MTPPEKPSAPEESPVPQKSSGKGPAQPLPPPIVGVFDERADQNGVVKFQMVMTVPEGLTATALNVKVEEPSSGDQHTADFTVDMSNASLEEILFRGRQTLFGKGRAFSKENLLSSATATGSYKDGCTCVVPLDPTCGDGHDQGPFPLSQRLDGRGCNVTTVLRSYEADESVSGHIALIVEYSRPD